MIEKSSKFIKRKYLSMLISGTFFTITDLAMSMIDIFVSGHLFGDTALAAVNIVTPLNNIVIFSAFIIAIGSGILYSRANGDFDKEKMCQVFSQGLIAAVAIGTIIFLLFLIFGDAFFSIYHLNDQIMTSIQEFIRYYKYTFIITPVFFVLAELIFSDGDDRISTASSIIQLVSKIVLSIILAKSMGLQGVGLASLISTLIALTILMIHFFKKENTLRFKWYFNLKSFFNVVRYSFIDAANFLYLSISQSFINWIIAVYFGDKYITVYTAVLIMVDFWVFFDGIGTAMIPLYNSYAGEKNHIGQQTIIRYSTISAAVEGIAFTAIYCVFSRFFVSLLGINDPELAAMTVSAIRIIGLASIFTSYIYLITSYCLMIDKIITGMILGGLNAMVLPMILTLILSGTLGITGIWWALTLSAFFTCIIGILIIKKKFLLFEKSDKDPRICIYSLSLSLESISKLNDKIEAFLTLNQIGEKEKYAVRFTFEEVLMLIYNTNKDKTIHAECSVILKDDIEIVIRDDGKIFNVLDPDMKIDSLNIYVVALAINSYYKNTKHIISTGFNKNIFRIKQ